VSSPSLSVASWSDLNTVYQENSAAALKVVNNALNSPHNTWNYPSPRSPCLQYPPASRTSSPTIPWSPTATSSPKLRFEFVVPGFPFLKPTGPGPYNIFIPRSPQYSTSSASAGITLVDPDTLEPTPIDPNPYVVCSLSPLLLHPPSKHFTLLPSSTSSNSEEKPPPKSSILLRQSLTSSSPHSLRIVGPSTNSLTAQSTTPRLKTSPSRTFPCPSLKLPLPRLLPPPRCHPLSDITPYWTPQLTSAPSTISLPPRLASLPMDTLISTRSTTSRTATSGFRQRNLSTAGSLTTFPRPQTSIPPHPHSSLTPSAPTPITPSTSTPTVLSPQSTSVPK